MNLAEYVEKLKKSEAELNHTELLMYHIVAAAELQGWSIFVDRTDNEDDNVRWIGIINPAVEVSVTVEEK